MEMSQLALQAGLPAEGKAIVDKGFAAGALGTGAEAERHKRLRDLANKQEAEARRRSTSVRPPPRQPRTATPGADRLCLRHDGRRPTRASADRAGIEGQPEAPRRRQAATGHGPAAERRKNKAKAVQVLRSVKGTDGTADLGACGR
jgi:hypothetical protein